MQIVKFENGKYALRKFSLLAMQYVYKDLVGYNNFWWTKRSFYFRDCLAHSAEEVRNLSFKVVEKQDV